MIGIFLGHQNSGKTLSMVYFGYDYYKKGYTIYSNLKLKYPYLPLTKKILTEYTTAQKQFIKSVFMIDEIYLFMDSRSSFSKENKVFSYLALQSSKRDINLFGSCQYFRTLDVRIREATFFQSYCSRVIKKDSNYIEVESGRRVLTEEENNNLYIKNCILQKTNNIFDYGVTTKKIYLKAKPIFNLYDTRQIMAIE